MFNTQQQFTIKAEKNKEFDKSCLIDTFNVGSGNIADCLEHCLENCRCQSFQIRQNTECQLCSSHKKENSSLLHDKDDCVYAMYEMRHLTETFQKLEGQCSGMSCSMKYNCCQQSDLCPNNKICKPINSQEQLWKRFTCECPEGYHGDNCDQPITSCQEYGRGSRKSGMYKVVDSVGDPLYEVYCHFDSDGAWTLVHSCSFANANGSDSQFKKSLSDNFAVGENGLEWSGYRLRKTRMESIKESSTFLQFTCDYEKHRDMEKLDYVQIRLGNISQDVLELNNNHTSYVTIGEGHGKIGGYDLNGCQVKLHQRPKRPLHVHIRHSIPDGKCKVSANDSSCTNGDKYFDNYASPSDCVKKVHRCVQNANSTTQLWFGMREVRNDTSSLGSSGGSSGS
ncbi:PREDICTED: uncharacterized protein LOC107347374 [Paramuricea clavata]|uniref:PREDICTED: uncharacterized protein LOC107347374 n=1 Tax=Paramuricea clavata TaxID=317549 RepID=A0A6S7LE54_PARCT|nr:PREDICTED: uncharacterized protein LOC107347374 [Paramuricea clavata]